jgi:glutamate-1-semialdehyde 2,1-aminomutase
MLTLFFSGSDPGSDPINNFAQASACDTSRYAAYFRHMFDRGIYVPPSQFEAMFVSLAHGDEEIDRTIQAVADFDG